LKVYDVVFTTLPTLMKTHFTIRKLCHFFVIRRVSTSEC